MVIESAPSGRTIKEHFERKYEEKDGGYPKFAIVTGPGISPPNPLSTIITENEGIVLGFSSATVPDKRL